MITDEISIILTAGHGGPGKLVPINRFSSATAGGDGGKGGDIYVSTTSDLSALNKFSGITEIKAEDGQKGEANRRSGKTGPDTQIEVPIGTSILNIETGETVELDQLPQNILICRGGKGGRGGNFRAQPGLPGQTINAKLILKLIAHFGLIGLPNAGKSSLLNALTNAKAEIGAYPFTTLEPNLGVLNGKILADIPGLIEGASNGRGLGIKFLKHIEKVNLLFHCIACDSQNVLADFNTIFAELTKFGQGLVQKPQVIVLTKTDLVTPGVISSHIERLSNLDYPIIALSIHDKKSLTKFKERFF